MPLASVRRTKIVATLGPSWDTPDKMTALLEAGVDVVRVNASHGTPEGRGRWIAEIKAAIAARSTAASAAVLLDLHGPRIRVGSLAEPMLLE
ncbi:MAG TPA: pyruvate kinase, partial [Gemmatimonadales bacterium]